MAKSRVAIASPRSPVAGGKTQAHAGAFDETALNALAPAALAWEFLRRNPAYVADYRKLRAGRLPTLPEHWGLAYPVDPDAEAVDHRAIWRAPALTPRAAGSLAGFPRASARR